MNKKVPWISIIIILINILVWLNTFSMDEQAVLQSYAMYRGALSIEPYRMFSSAFVHSSVIHLLSNMALLFAVGSILESRIGRLRFIVIYLLSVAGSGVAIDLLANANEGHIGASGAVWGCMTAALVQSYRTGEDSRGLIRCVLINFVYSFASGISWQGHIGGGISGALAALLLCSGNKADANSASGSSNFRAWKKMHPNCDETFYFNSGGKPKRKGLSVGAIIAITIGSLVMLLFIAVLAGSAVTNDFVNQTEKIEEEVDPEIVLQNMKEKCNEYSYEEISRYPDQYKEQYAVFNGEVIQSVENGDAYELRVNITKNEFGLYTDTIYVTYKKLVDSECRILEGDSVTVYGMLDGIYTYTSVADQKISIPLLRARYVGIDGILRFGEEINRGVDSSQINLSDEAEFKSSCTEYTYDEIARNPAKVKGKLAVITGSVVQVMESGNSVDLRIVIPQKELDFSSTLIATYNRKKGESRILENDIVTVYGILSDLVTYKTILGNSVTVPKIEAKFIERQ